MLLREALDTFVTVGIHEPVRAVEPERRLCSRCGKLEATVSICEWCFLELAAQMAVRKPVENSPRITARWIGWLGILLVGLIAIAAGLYLYVFPH